MTKYPGKNPNLTDEQVENWLLRVSGQAPDQLEEERRWREREAKRDRLFPHHVECNIEKVTAAFPESKNPDEMYDWIHKFDAWLEANCGPKNDGWAFELAQNKPISGAWTRTGFDFYFKDKAQADILAAQFGGGNPRLKSFVSPPRKRAKKTK